MPLALTLLLMASTGVVHAAESNLNPLCFTDPAAFAFIGLTGVERTCINVGGKDVSDDYDGAVHERCFYTYTPSCAGEDAPLVMDMHGTESCPFFSAAYTGWAQKAAEECFVLVLPMGNTDKDFAPGTCWSLPGGLDFGDGNPSPSCCCGVTKVRETDDLSFLRNVVALTVEKNPKIDTKRVYMAGHSNGCIASISMGTKHSDLVAAVGCHSGTTFTNIPTGADSEKEFGYTYPYIPTPMIMIHGKEDDNVSYGLATVAKGLVSQANGCTTETTVTNENPTLNNYDEIKSTGCTNGADVTLIAIDDVGHFPYPGCIGYCYEDGDGETDTLIDTTALAWDFMKTHSSAVAPVLKYTGVEAEKDGEKDDDKKTSSAPIARSFAFATLGSLGLFNIANAW